MENEKKQLLSCMDCPTQNCSEPPGAVRPGFCLTDGVSTEELEELKRVYGDIDQLDGRLAIASAETEGQYYKKLTRLEEIVVFAKKIGAKKIGIASCTGLAAEAKVFAKVLENNGLIPYGVVCKVGMVEKEEIGIRPEDKVDDCDHICNPILQARLLNRAGTELNVIVGLCVGHDSLFIRHSEAPVTTLITKDRVLCHNPAAAIYLSDSYYSNIMENKDVDVLEEEHRKQEAEAGRKHVESGR